MVYLVEWNDEDGDILGRAIYCNSLCADRDPSTEQPNTEQGDWPGGWESDHNEYCPSCGAMLSHGLNDGECTDTECPDCPPVVVNLVAPHDRTQRCDSCGCVQYLSENVLETR